MHRQAHLGNIDRVEIGEGLSPVHELARIHHLAADATVVGGDDARPFEVPRSALFVRRRFANARRGQQLPVARFVAFRFAARVRRGQPFLASERPTRLREFAFRRKQPRASLLQGQFIVDAVDADKHVAAPEEPAGDHRVRDRHDTTGDLGHQAALGLRLHHAVRCHGQPDRPGPRLHETHLGWLDRFGLRLGHRPRRHDHDYEDEADDGDRGRPQVAFEGRRAKPHFSLVALSR